MSEIMVLCVDDDKLSFNLIKHRFKRYGIETFYAKSTEQMIEMLPDIYYKLSAIILDIMGIRTNDQKKESDDFVINAIVKLAEVKRYSDIERIIVSGVRSAYEKHISSLGKDYKFFLKESNDLDKLAEYIIKIANNKEHVRIRRMFQNIFKIMEKRNFPSRFENSLQKILIEQETNDNSKIKDFLGDIRRIHEFIYKKVSNEIVELNEATSFSQINKFLAGNRNYNNKAIPKSKYYYEDRIIENASEYIHWVGSSHGAHSDEVLADKDICTNDKYFPTNYTLKTTLYSLLDVILWYDRFMEKYKNEE